jgi:hypothetical protein
MSEADAVVNVSPKPPAPLYPDVPWWAVLITAFVFALVGVLAGVYGSRPGAPGLPGTGSAGSGILGRLVVDTVSYIPHILLLFGVLADMFTLDGAWSIPSLIGVLAIFANYVFQYFWKGIDELVKTGINTVNKGNPPAPAAPAAAVGGGPRPFGFAARGPPAPAARRVGSLFEGYKACSVQGFEGFATPFAPQTLVVTATVFAYYCFDLVGNRGWVNSIAAILAFILAFAGQVAVIDFQNPSDTGGCEPKGGSTLSGAVRALFEGLMFGGIGYGIVQTYAPTRLPSSTISPFPRKSASDLSPGPDGKMYDADGYPYVVLPNGQAVPDVSDATSRAAFGEVAGKSAGSTETLSSGCPVADSKCPKKA